ncbi:MAG: nucleotide exchange factor GrpE [Deltaproteobacteria bacterium]|nr:nucleotide exchange factor GrpE [Deltaproteobacteria bacterium]MCF8118979.1 nucleotide exchange factor GrpE [Deltaproteobacteria bacterium]
MTRANKKEVQDTQATNPGPAGEAPNESRPETEAPEHAELVPLEEMTREQLIEKLEEMEKERDDNQDRYLRAKAEMENVKKRFQKEKQDLLKYANESLLKQLLPVADNLEKAIGHSQEQNSLKTLLEGVDLTLKGLLDTLNKAGVEPLEAVGEPFDPNFHEAMSEAESEEAPPGTVIQEFQKGYTLNNRLLRPAMVVISKKPG